MIPSIIAKTVESLEYFWRVAFFASQLHVGFHHFGDSLGVPLSVPGKNVGVPFPGCSWWGWLTAAHGIPVSYYTC